MCLLYDSGARVQELADIRIRDLHLDSPAQVKLTGKGRKTRSVPLMNQTVSILKEYLKKNGLDKQKYGVDVLIEQSTEPDSFKSIFGASFLEEDNNVENMRRYECQTP